jgi:ADP-ribose pyrophosphatase YjhB (NUDIX family)
VGDSPAEAVVREIREESGFETRATKLLALLDRNRHGHPPHVNHIYKVFLR